MDVSDVYLELYGRVPPLARAAVEGLDADQLATVPPGAANSIAWLTWHCARLQDHHISELVGLDQLWVSGGWAERFDMAPDPDDMGYGHSPARAASVRPEGPGVLLEYLAVAQERTEGVLATVTPESLARIVDDRWDPPVSLGVRLVSVADDCLQHFGQAAYVRGMLGFDND